MDIDNLTYARLQMAFTLGSHIIIACFGVGMPLLMCIAEGLYLKTKDETWKLLARRWAKAFAVLFAVGAVSGTVLSFELGLLWPEFMGRFGSIIGFPFTMEGFAFFLEAIFVGIYIYSWNKLSPLVHWLMGIPINLSGALSAWFVVTANSWMNVPRGFKLEGDKIVEADPIAAMLNPATGAQTTHMLLAAYMVTGFMIAAYYAWVILRGSQHTYHKRALILGLLLAVFVTPFQMLVGDWSSKVVAETQPVKLAAMEGHYNTEKNAGLMIGGIPDDQDEVTRYGLKIPGLLSFLAYGDFNAEVKGLKDFPREDRPPALIVHLAFQMMVGIGTWLLILSIWTFWKWGRGTYHKQDRLFLWALIISGPLSILALESGWVVTEVGRQPWIVTGVMRTKDAVTAAEGIGGLFFITCLIYLMLAVGCITVLRLLARVPLEAETHGT